MKLVWIFIAVIVVIVGFFFLPESGSDDFSNDFGGIPGLENIPNEFEINFGEDFYYDIDFEEGYIFTDDTELFDITSETGEISFVAEEVGEYNVVIIAMKNAEDFYYKSITFKVVS
jgi:hypothetical protein